MYNYPSLYLPYFWFWNIFTQSNNLSKRVTQTQWGKNTILFLKNYIYRGFLYCFFNEQQSFGQIGHIRGYTNIKQSEEILDRDWLRLWKRWVISISLLDTLQSAVYLSFMSLALNFNKINHTIWNGLRWLANILTARKIRKLSCNQVSL